MKKRYLFIFIILFLILLTLFSFLFLFFILPISVLPFLNFESECVKIEKNNLISKKKDFIKIGKKKLDCFFFKRAMLLIISFVFSYMLISLFKIKDFNSVKILYNYIFFNTALNLNIKQIFFIIYLLIYLYIFLLLNFVYIFRFVYLHKYWKKNSRDILLRNNQEICVNTQNNEQNNKY